MKITAIGTGGALGDGANTNLVFTQGESNELMCFDCGRTWPEAMKRFGFKWQNVSGVYVSHLHGDHSGGLEVLGFNKYFKMGFPFGQHRPLVIGLWEVIHNLWDHTLKGGMESIQNQRNTLNTFFDPCPVPPNGSFMWKNIMFQLVQTIHVVDDRRIVPSAGLIFHTDTKSVFITGDTQFAPNQIMSYYQSVDLIIQDCEVAQYPGSVHAQYHELCTLPSDIKRKMWLIHYDTHLEQDNVQLDGFAGAVVEGQEFEV